MKLTLRTLLAFLDGTMNKDDAAAMRAKIRESEPIRDLIQRIRHVIGQPQLPAPKTSKGTVGDPNSTSEYIDSTLDLERVAEFEKMSIGSDMLLAEVAESHQILASLAEIDKGVSGRLRNRLYKTTETIYKSEIDEPEMFPVVDDHSSIQEEYDDVDVVQKKNQTDFELAPPRLANETDEPSGTFGDIPPIQASAAKSKAVEIGVDIDDENLVGDFDAKVELNVQTQKPPRSSTNSKPAKSSESDQKTTTSSADNTGLQDKSRSASSDPTPRAKLFPVILATACITALVVLLAASYMYRPGDREGENQVAENQNGQRDNNEQGDSSDDQSQESEGNQEDQDDSDSSSKGSNDLTQKEQADATEKQLDGEDKTGTTSAEQVLNSESDSKKSDGQPESKGTTEKDSSEKKEGKEEVLNLFKDKDYGEGKKPGSGKSSAGKKASEKNPGGAAKSAEMEKKDTRPSRLTDTKKLMAESAGLANGEAVGVMKSPLQPTLRKTNLPEAVWINLAQEQAVYINDTIVALPDCVSDVEVLESVRLQLFGLCRIELKKNEGQVLPRVDVQNGVVTFDNMQEPNNTIDVSAAGQQIQVTFVDKKSRFAVVRQQMINASGMTEIIQLAALKGRVLCKYDGKVVSLDPENLLNFKNGTFETLAFKSVPKVMSQRPSTLTTSAKESFFSLGLENPIFAVAAKKALSDSKPYLRKFAAISGLALGEHDNLIQFLGDEQNRSFWRDVFLFARERALTDQSFRMGFQSYCSGPDDAAPGKPAVKQGDWKNPEDGTRLFEFVTVTSNQALENGLDTKLVDGLQSTELWIRVASIQSLFALTGKTKFFRPEDREEKRRKWVKAWEKSLEAGEVRISTPFLVQQFE